MLRTRLLWMAALTLALAVVPAFGQAPAAPDRVAFEIRVHGYSVGTERVQYENAPDSLRVSSSSLQLLGPLHADTLLKQTKLVATLEDLDLHAYASAQRFLGHVVERGVECEDTLIHVSTFANGRGDQDIVARPPGRLFVIDPGSFVAFDLLCRMLRGREFVKRPVNMLILGPRDSVITATLDDGGADTLTWGAGRVVTRRVMLSDRTGSYRLWMDSEGRMLRLENAWSGVTVERQPPPAPTGKPRQKKS